jgi:hypothetical protein
MNQREQVAVDCLVDLLHPEDEGDTFLRNVG